MSDAERRLKEFPARFPRPDEHVTRRVQRLLLRRLRSATARRRAVLGGAVLAALVVGAALGAGVVAMTAGAATDRVTFEVRPLILGASDTSAKGIGQVSNGRADEEVVFETRECGASAYRVFAGVTTRAGGVYDASLGIWINAVVRARWRNAVSDPIEVKRRVGVGLRRLSGGRFEVSAGGQKKFEGKPVRIERWGRRAQRWVAVRQVILRRSYAAGAFVGSMSEFRLRVGKGVQLRAVFALEHARPCYLGGVSRIVRT